MNASHGVNLIGSLAGQAVEKHRSRLANPLQYGVLSTFGILGLDIVK